MARSRNGEAIGPSRRCRSERGRLRTLLARAKKRGDLATWRRAKAVFGYLRGDRVIDLAKDLAKARALYEKACDGARAGGHAPALVVEPGQGRRDQAPAR